MERLRKYLPDNTADYILNWFQSHPVQMVVSRARNTKLGDYRPPVHHHPARISVNHDLNKFDFLITLVHEMAHHEVWLETPKPHLINGFKKRQPGPKPHGKEWQNNYRRLMQPVLNESVFPGDLLHTICSHLKNPPASSKANIHMAKALKNYDEPDETVFITVLPKGCIFALPTGRVFKKGDILRKRIRCECLDNKRTYLFSPVARVIPRSTWQTSLELDSAH